MNRSIVKLHNILLGSGSHARALLGLARDCGLHSFSCVSPLQPEPSQLTDLPWLGNDDILEKINPQNVRLINGIGSTGSTSLRQKLFIKSRELGFHFDALVHPSAILADNVTFHEGIQIFPGVILQPGANIFDNVLLNTGCIIEHDCEIGAHSHVAPGAVLSGAVKVGEGVHVGASSVVAHGIKIGSNSIIGMGAVVLRDVPERTIVVGNPARVLRTLDTE